MYKNRKHVKECRYNLRVNEPENELIAQLADIEEMQKTTLLRYGAMKYIRELAEKHKEKLEELEDAIG